MEPATQGFSWGPLSQVVAEVATWFGSVALGVNSIMLGASLLWLALMVAILSVQHRVDRLDGKIRDVRHLLREQQELLERMNEAGIATGVKPPPLSAGETEPDPAAQAQQAIELPSLSQVEEQDRVPNAP